MFNNLQLARPLAILDLETTGLQPHRDRIVELALIKYAPDGEQSFFVRRVNPGVAIPPAATAIHGIDDSGVAGQPSFGEVSGELLAFLSDCDLAGYGIKRFDLQFLRAEFGRAGREMPLENRAIIDVMEIFHHREPRDLAAALFRYCGRKHDAGHAALADALATGQVLDQMLACYPDLPQTPAELDQHFRNPDAIDRDGRFVRNGEQILFGFGKYLDKTLATVAQSDPGYLRWMLRAGFARDTTQIVLAALQQAETDKICRNQFRPVDTGPAFVPITHSPPT